MENTEEVLNAISTQKENKNLISNWLNGPYIPVWKVLATSITEAMCVHGCYTMPLCQLPDLSFCNVSHSLSLKKIRITPTSPSQITEMQSPDFSPIRYIHFHALGPTPPLQSSAAMGGWLAPNKHIIMLLAPVLLLQKMIWRKNAVICAKQSFL